MTLHVAWKGLPPRNRRAWSRWRWRVCSLSSKERARPKPSCEPFGSYLIQAPRLSMILRPRLPPHGCQCATRAPSISGHRRDLPFGHKRGQRFDEGGPTNRALDGRAEMTAWLAVRSLAAKYFSGLPDCQQVDGARSWKRPAASSWRSFAANRSRSERRTFTQPSNWLGNSAASPWTKTTCGWPRRRSPSVRHWSAAIRISEVLMACRWWRWSSRWATLRRYDHFPSARRTGS